MPEKTADKVVRAMTNDGQFRVIAATMSQSCAEAVKRQEVPESLRERQSELMCAAVLVRETMQPGNRVQIILKDPQGHQIVADALPEGSNRSIVNPGEKSGDGAFAEQGLLQVNYTLRNGELHQGIVSVEDSNNVSNAVMRYLKDSEQISAFVTVESYADEKGERRVGGFVVQVTPEVLPEGLQGMLAHLEKFPTLENWLKSDQPEPVEIIGKLLSDHEHTILADSALRFGCTCSKERMLLGLGTLALGELAEMMEEKNGIEVSCNACNENYNITSDDLGRLIAERKEPGTPAS